jgi:hypothetical protein
MLREEEEETIALQCWHFFSYSSQFSVRLPASGTKEQLNTLKHEIHQNNI